MSYVWNDTTNTPGGSRIWHATNSLATRFIPAQ
jgi:hypothetical protein